MPVIEDAGSEDLLEILAIYNEVIRTSTSVYTETEYSLQQGRLWFESKRDGGPFIVARDASGIAGFGSFGEFRKWPCYRHSVEHSVYVRADCRGQGVGRALLVELLARAAAAGKHVVLAAVDADNVASLALHQQLGFDFVGRFREVGFKFGRWLDLVFLQRIIHPDEFS
jgi:L-amino acid N-acyltransferase YncA